MRSLSDYHDLSLSAYLRFDMGFVIFTMLSRHFYLNGLLNLAVVGLGYVCRDADHRHSDLLQPPSEDVCAISGASYARQLLPRACLSLFDRSQNVVRATVCVGVATDFLIAGLLCYYLQRSRTGWSRSVHPQHYYGCEIKNTTQNRHGYHQTHVVGCE